MHLFRLRRETRNPGSPGEYDPAYFQWNSSVTRTDTEGGACEVIYVSDIEILKKSNPVSHYAYAGSFYGLLILIFMNAVWFIADLRKDL